jgi:iron complex outermembrane recepter protein
MKKFDDIERNIIMVVPNQPPVQIFANAASATIKGAEAEISWIVFDGFRFDGNGGLTDAKYNSFIGLAGLPPGKSATDLKIDRLSKWKYVISGQYDWDMIDGSWSANISYSWRPVAYSDVLNAPAFAQPAYGLINAGLSYTRGKTTFSVYRRNLANKNYTTGSALSLNYYSWGGEPRTHGIKVAVKM